MTPVETLHERLIARQSDDELRRKRDKASRRGFWTQEDLDYHERVAIEMAELIKAITWEDAP